MCCARYDIYFLPYFMADYGALREEFYAANQEIHQKHVPPSPSRRRLSDPFSRRGGGGHQFRLGGDRVNGLNVW